MDTGKGFFIAGESAKELAQKLSRLGELTSGVNAVAEMQGRLAASDGVFRVGEIIELRGSRFRIHSITPKKMILRLLPRAGL